MVQYWVAERINVLLPAPPVFPIGALFSSGETQVEPANRKLIRPSLNEPKDPMTNRRTSSPPQKRATPPEQTNAENFYYMKQMQSKTLMVIVMKDGETLEGIIEWYDKGCLKVNREGAPNLLIFKPNIKYMYKA